MGLGLGGKWFRFLVGVFNFPLFTWEIGNVIYCEGKQTIGKGIWWPGVAYPAHVHRKFRVKLLACCYTGFVASFRLHCFSYAVSCSRPSYYTTAIYLLRAGNTVPLSGSRICGCHGGGCGLRFQYNKRNSFTLGFHASRLSFSRVSAICKLHNLWKIRTEK